LFATGVVYTRVVDTCGKFTSGIVDAGGKFSPGINNFPLVSLITAAILPPVSLMQGSAN
jgi:hypothetical protein